MSGVQYRSSVLLIAKQEGLDPELISRVVDKYYECEQIEEASVVRAENREKDKRDQAYHHAVMRDIENAIAYRKLHMDHANESTALAIKHHKEFMAVLASMADKKGAVLL